jgi:S1-C subfamily serine protease
VVTEVAGHRVSGLADLFRAIWRQGPAGTDIALTVVRDGKPMKVRVHSADRTDFFRKPSLQ